MHFARLKCRTLRRLFREFYVANRVDSRSTAPVVPDRVGDQLFAAHPGANLKRTCGDHGCDRGFPTVFVEELLTNEGHVVAAGLGLGLPPVGVDHVHQVKHDGVLVYDFPPIHVSLEFACSAEVAVVRYGVVETERHVLCGQLTPTVMKHHAITDGERNGLARYVVQPRSCDSL